MDIDKEIQKLIDDYVEQIQNKEGELLDFKKKIDEIILISEKELEALEKNLNDKFDAGNLKEEEYILKFREEKEKILKKTKEKLDFLVQSLK